MPQELENLALRQEISSLKKPFLEGRGVINSLPPPAPHPEQSAAETLSASNTNATVVVGLPYIAMYYITRSIITSNSHIASGYSPILVTRVRSARLHDALAASTDSSLNRDTDFKSLLISRHRFTARNFILPTTFTHFHLFELVSGHIISFLKAIKHP
jgi:hypothetical protein